jgi:hypothetical protein
MCNIKMKYNLYLNWIIQGGLYTEKENVCIQIRKYH